MTRISYDVSKPFEMPEIEFSLNELYNLSEFKQLTVELIANEESGRLNLMIILEDDGGHENDVNPISLTEDQLFFDDMLHSYSFDLTSHLASLTGAGGTIDISRVRAIHIYINAGIEGKVTTGTFWLNKLELNKNQS